MFTTAKKLSIFSVIFTCLHLLGAILLLFCLSSLRLGFAVNFCIIVYVIASTVGALLMTVSLRSLCQDLDMNYENNISRFHDLQTKINELEKQIKN